MHQRHLLISHCMVTTLHHMTGTCTLTTKKMRLLTYLNVDLILAVLAPHSGLSGAVDSTISRSYFML